MGYYWLRYLGSLIIWTFKGFKGKFSEIEGNNVYSFYVGIGFISLIVFLSYIIN